MISKSCVPVTHTHTHHRVWAWYSTQCSTTVFAHKYPSRKLGDSWINYKCSSAIFLKEWVSNMLNIKLIRSIYDADRLSASYYLRESFDFQTVCWPYIWQSLMYTCVNIIGLSESEWVIICCMLYLQEFMLFGYFNKPVIDLYMYNTHPGCLLSGIKRGIACILCFVSLYIPDLIGHC